MHRFFINLQFQIGICIIWNHKIMILGNMKCRCIIFEKKFYIRIIQTCPQKDKCMSKNKSVYV